MDIHIGRVTNYFFSSSVPVEDINSTHKEEQTNEAVN